MPMETNFHALTRFQWAMTLTLKTSHGLTFVCQRLTISCILKVTHLFVCSLYISTDSTGASKWFMFLTLKMTWHSPFLELHDLSTRELANRIGGSKTGLLNGSMVIDTLQSISLYYWWATRAICKFWLEDQEVIVSKVSPICQCGGRCCCRCSDATFCCDHIPNMIITD